MSDNNQIMGVVNTKAEAKVGTSYRGEEVIEIKGIFEQSKSSNATVIVLSKKAAINLASQLFGIILDMTEEN